MACSAAMTPEVMPFLLGVHQRGSHLLVTSRSIYDQDQDLSSAKILLDQQKREFSGTKITLPTFRLNAVSIRAKVKNSVIGPEER